MEEKKECQIGNTIFEDLNGESCHGIVDDMKTSNTKYDCDNNETKDAGVDPAGSNSSNLNSQVKPDVKPNTSLWGMRHVQVLLLFFCFFVSFYMRANLSMAIVAMTNKNSSQSHIEVYDWTEFQKGVVLSSFYLGYFFMLPLAGQLGLKYTSKLLLGLSLFEGSILSLITPFVVSIGGWQALCGLRFLQGLNQGFLLPISYTLASKWSPPNERNRFVGISLNGATLGICLAMPIAGYLAGSKFGWPLVFYIAGIFGFVWTFFWFLYGADSPSSHPKISAKERDFIVDSLGNDVDDFKKLKTPWKSIFTSLPVWALICAHLGNGWAFGILSTQLPSFIKSALGFDIESNGLLSALPFLFMWILTFPMCWLGDELISRGILSKTVSRKLWTAVSLSGGPLTFISMTCVGKNPVIIMALMVTAATSFIFIFIGYNINHLDLTPNYAGVLMGICNGFEMITTFIAPLAVGLIVYKPSYIELWQRLFMVTAAIGVTSTLIYGLFGSGKIQPWNDLGKSGNSIPFQTKQTTKSS